MKPEISRLLKNMQDITQRKRAEEERDQLLKREQAARAVSEAALKIRRQLTLEGRVLSDALIRTLTAIVDGAGIR